jgi:sodium/potassium-transporting ATPase subunit alpha
MEHGKGQPNGNPASGIRAIDVHLLPKDNVFLRFSTSPSLGLEAAAVERRGKTGKNVISPPPTQYWKKALNYVFGGFNFLMWIAFIVTIVRFPPFECYGWASFVRE